MTKNTIYNSIIKLILLIFTNPNFSKINFERYLPYLQPYMNKIQYDLDVVDDGVVLLAFYNNDFDLSLKFLKNGKTEILSLDRLENDTLSIHNPKETMCYVLRGNFSSSSLVEKSYKINCVLSMLNYDSVAVKQVTITSCAKAEIESVMDSLKLNNGEFLTSLNPNEKSKNNFQCYLLYLKPYLDKHTYHLNVNKGIISLYFKTSDFSLLLTFLTNGFLTVRQTYKKVIKIKHT